MRVNGVPNVPENSLSPFAAQLFPSKPHSCERRAWREVPSRYNEDRSQLPWQVEPDYDVGLLLDVQKELKRDPPPNARCRILSQKSHF